MEDYKIDKIIDMEDYKIDKIIDSDGNEVIRCIFKEVCMYKHPTTDEYHRIGGPALKWTDGEESWYKHGRLHRENGPAVVRHNRIDYYIEGKLLYKEEFYRRLVKRRIQNGCKKGKGNKVS